MRLALYLFLTLFIVFGIMLLGAFVLALNYLIDKIYVWFLRRYKKDTDNE